MAEAPSSTPRPEEQDPLAKALGPSKIEAFLEENKAKLIIGFAVLIAVAIGTIIAVFQHQSAQATAAQAFTSASTLADLNQVIEQQAGTVDGGNALLRKAELLKQEGKPEEARTALADFRKQYPEHPRLGQALLLLGQMAENAGDRGKARDFYQQVPSNSDLAPLARMRLADLMFQEGRVAEAREAYSEIEREFAENPWASALKDRVKEVNLQLNKPEWPNVLLEKPEPAPAPAKAAGQTPATKPGEGKPVLLPQPAPKSPALKPEAAKPGQPAPEQPQPSQTQPAPKPAQPQPSQTQPAPKTGASKPAPAQPKAAETKPVESKPAAPEKPQDAKPKP